MKTTLMTCSVDVPGAVQDRVVVPGNPAVRERSTAPVAAPAQATGLPATGLSAPTGTAVLGLAPFGAPLSSALPGPPRGAPV